MILLQPAIDPVLFSLGILQIRWYSLAYIVGFLLGFYVIKKINDKQKNKIKDKILDEFFVWSVIGVILGGRIGYIIFYQTSLIFLDPISILYIWKGGMSFHGGLIGIIISMIIFCRYKSINFFQISDLISSVAPIGLFFGRIANFINTELYGRVTEFPIAIIYPTIDQLPRHPSQLYEALFEGLILFFILRYYRIKNYDKKSSGLITALFLIYYGLFRSLIEFLREPDTQLGLIFNFISMGQLLSIPLILAGIIIYYQNRYNGR